MSYINHRSFTKFLNFAFVFALSVGLHVAASAEDLKFVKPEKVGMSSEALKRITEFSQRQIDNETHMGFVIMVARHGKIVYYEASGQYGIDNPKPMDSDALFRIYSMTKPITTVAAMMLYERGEFQLNDPVSKFLPELADLKLYGAPEDHRVSPITIEQLMTHTAGFSYGFRPDHPVNVAYIEAKFIESKNSADFLEKVQGLPLFFEPGTRYYYSIATDILGILVERISEQTLAEFFEKEIFKPLGMKDTFFYVPEEKIDRLTTNHLWHPEHQKIVPAPPQFQFGRTSQNFHSGGGGLISTAMDYMRFCEMLRRGGTFNGTRILGVKTIQYMTMNQLTDEVLAEGRDEYPQDHLYPGQGFGLGFGVIIDPSQSQVVSSKGEYSWGGMADTKFWIDPEEDLVVILMTQLINAPSDTRYKIKAATYQALDDLGNQP